MIKTILVPVSGTSSDADVFATALALAEPLGAHLAFHHVRLTAMEAAANTPHMAYYVANGLPGAFDFLTNQVDTLAIGAKAHVTDFCHCHGLTLAPAGGSATASWTEEPQDPEENLLDRVRHADLTVVGRQHQTDYMPAGLIEKMLLEGGRPLVIASDQPPPASIGTIMVGWQEKPEAARALTAALPLLRIAKRVILTQISRKRSAKPALTSLARNLERHGIQAEIREVLAPFVPAETMLPGMALDSGADLLVVGGYSKGPLREMLFGGVTRSLLEGADVPVFLLH